MHQTNQNLQSLETIRKVIEIGFKVTSNEFHIMPEIVDHKAPREV